MTEPSAPRHQPIIIFVLLLLSLFTLIPLLNNPGLPNGSDVLYHVYRVAEMDRSWEQGVLFPRWADGLYFGYGSPLFHYYASLTYHSTSVLIRLFNLTALDALRAMVGLSLVGGSLTMYLFASQRSGSLGGFIAGLVYIYSPYLVYTEPYARGTYPELLAFALAPLMFWRFERLLHRPQGINFALAAVSLCLLILSHNLMSLVFALILGLWIGWHGVASLMAIGAKNLRAEGLNTLRPYLLALAAAGLGVGLAAFFWLPVILERDAIQLENVVGVALLDYRNFFVSLGDLLAPTDTADGGAINGLRNRVNIGLAQWLLGSVGFIATIILIIGAIRRGKHDDPVLRNGVFFGLISLLLIYLITPNSNGIWESVSVLSLLQFPWRLLGPLVFALAILASMNALWIDKLFNHSNVSLPNLAFGSVLLITAMIISTAIPTFYVPEWSNTEVDTSIEAYHQVEVAGLQMGTTFTDEYRPRAVSSPPGHTDSLLADYADGYPVDHANRDVLPPTADLQLIDSGPQHNQWRITADEPFTMEIYTYDWAGWTAEIDGENVPITPSPNHGLITFPVPAGEHEIRLYLGSTPPRTAGMMISVVALILTLAGWRIIGKRWISDDESPMQPTAQRSAEIAVTFGGLIALVLVFMLYREGIAWDDSPPGESPAEITDSFQLDEQFSVVGYDINKREFFAGETLEVIVYWHPLQPYDVNFSSFLHVSNGGPPVAQVDKLHPGGRAIAEWWTPDGYIYDEYDVWLPDTLAPGEYNLYVGLYTCELMPPGECGNGYRPTVRDESGEIVGDTVPLGTISVR